MEQQNLSVININESTDVALQTPNSNSFDLDVFVSWMSENCTQDNLSTKFETELPNKYRMALFNYVNRNFNNESAVNNTTLFYWKVLVYSFMKNSAKYGQYAEFIDIDYVNKTCGLTLVKMKHIFKCFVLVDNILDHVCWFKENDNIYYVS